MSAAAELASAQALAINGSTVVVKDTLLPAAPEHVSFTLMTLQTTNHENMASSIGHSKSSKMSGESVAY